MEDQLILEEKSGLKNFLFGKINKKILFGFILIAIIITISGSLSVWEVTKITKHINEGMPLSIEHIESSSNLDQLAQFIRYYDEILTMSARNYAFTSDIKWKTRYFEYVPKLDDSINEAINKGDDTDNKFFSSVNDANIALIEMEEKAIALIDQGNSEEAIKILESEEYWKQKEIYKTGLVKYVERRGNEYDEALIASTLELRDITENSKETTKNIIYFIIIAIILTVLTAILVGLFISRKISNPVEQLQKATIEIEKKNFKTRVNIKTGDELEDLGNSFNKTIMVLENLDKEHKQIDKAKTEFLSITSHELRSPMTPMRAQLQMLMGEYFGKLNQKQKDSLNIVLRNTERLDNIIIDFLEISRIEAARLKFNFKKTDLTKTINQLVKEMQGFMPEKKIRIITKMDKLPIIEVDPDRVSQVLRNLINNAKKFSKPGTTIEISAKLMENSIQFSVKDQGIGIEQEEQIRIFEPFFQAEQTMYRKHGGTGLGLAIVRGIVESQEGKVWLESQAGKGTTFYFTIPTTPVKNIRPIRLLFSEKKDIEKKLEIIFHEMLGPLGKQEFELIKMKKETSKEKIIEHINLYAKKRIITKERGEEIKQKARELFGEKKPITTEKLVSSGLIKKPTEKT